MIDSRMRCILVLPLVYLLASCQNFIGVQGQKAVTCDSDNTLVGFSSIKRLNQYMSTIWTIVNKGGNIEPPYYFVLCPDTVFDDDVIYPVLNDTWIVCGRKGQLEDNCVLSRNETQILISPVDAPDRVTTKEIEQVNFMGLTLQSSVEIPVKAYGTKDSKAFFYDCRFHSNTGKFSIHIANPKEDESTAMLVQIQKSIFENSNHTHSTIFNLGGSVQMMDVIIRNNQNAWGVLVDYNNFGRSVSLIDTRIESTENYFGLATIGGNMNLVNVTFQKNNNDISNIFVSDGGKLHVQESSFKNNQNEIGAAIVDFNSFLVLNDATNIGENNGGATECEGFLQMEKNSTCDSTACPGYCCNFGNNTCDLTTPPPTASPSSSASPTSGDSENESKDDSEDSSKDDGRKSTSSGPVTLPVLTMVYALTFTLFSILF